MGVGQPLSMKLKNVHLPHPQPNGSFREPSIGGSPVFSLRFAAPVVVLSEIITAGGALARDILPVGTFLDTWIKTSTERGVQNLIQVYEQTLHMYLFQSLRLLHVFTLELDFYSQSKKTFRLLIP